MTTLLELLDGRSGRVRKVSLPDKTSYRLSSMGVRVGATITRLGCAPTGDPIIYKVGTTTLAIRISDSRGVEIEL